MRLKYNKEIFDLNELPDVHIDNKLKTYLAKDRDKVYVNVRGENFVFEMIEDDDFGDEGSEVQNENRAEISAPMPGRVIKVNVNVGDRVEEGDILLTVEAMKMETRLYSPISGIIKEVDAKPEDRVSSDDVLVKIEKE